MTMLLPLFILVGLLQVILLMPVSITSRLWRIKYVNVSPGIVHFWQKYAWHGIQCPDTLRCWLLLPAPLAPFTPIVTGALFLYFCFALTLSVIDFRTQLLPDNHLTAALAYI